MQMSRDVDGAADVRNVGIGFAGELYENDEEGFRTKRTDDGKPVKAEFKSPEEQQQATAEELDEFMETLNAQAESNDFGQ